LGGGIERGKRRKMISASWKKSFPSKRESNEDAIKKEDCYQGFFFIDGFVFGLLELMYWD
jgi:hypothetical protein